MKDASLIAVPPLKWAGGKRWFVKNHADLFPKRFTNYLEPFLGSAAVFFALTPTEAVLADSNEDLINFYRSVRDYPDELTRLLLLHQKRHSSHYYYAMRTSKPRSNVALAAKFLYLNRTCWNGLYRVNGEGMFNVPVGTKNAVVLPTDDFTMLSIALTGSISILAQDFEETLEMSSVGDFVFVDPPYTAAHNNNGFLKYNQRIFSWQDQERLRDAVARAMRRGAQVLVTNANHESIRTLYQGLGRLQKVSRFSRISGLEHGRGHYEEAVIKCY